MNRIAKILGLAALTAALAACGGGGGTPPDTPAATDRVPASAFASVQAFFAYVGSLSADDGAEPLDVGDTVPPVSDADEPLPLS
jgi:hypothetical protein